MNLKDIADSLFEDSKKTPLRGLGAISEAEKYLQQAYEGRYLFELIQNVRDANKEINQDGEIFIEFKENNLSISNTGAEFSPKGIEGITTIGQSTKKSQEYIGFKGIGFKSIQEITEEPKIITRYGSVYFDRTLTLKKYSDQILVAEQVPLFYFPHFQERRLSYEEIQKGIVTKIELPVKETITEEKILEAFSEIKPKQLILLGNIKNLRFQTENKIINYSIKKNQQKKFIEVKKNDDQSVKFRYYIPSSKVVIPDSIIQSLEGKEKEIFSKGSHVDINVVLELADNGQFSPIKDAKLYLFYPLQISSGFRFIIHSYFIVNPERTALRDSILNDFLLSSIGHFIGKEILKNLKETKANTNRVLCFKRNPDAKLNSLYDALVTELKNQRFIYDSSSKKYFSSNEVMIADGVHKGLFSDGKLGNRQLIYTDDPEVKKWMQDEFSIPYLSHEHIAKEIESECKRQLKLKKLKFFQILYNYVSKHEGLNLTGRKVLITEDWKLVSSEEDVFYGGSRRTPINLPVSIKKQIHFIHKDIKLTDFREGKSKIGISEFNTHELVRRLLKLFDKSAALNSDILNTLYNIQPVDTKSELEIKEKILLPIKGSGKWLSPLKNPIYFDNANLRELYPEGNFIDQDILKWTGETNPVPFKDFLLRVGVWEIPAIYISDKTIRVSTKEKRDKTIFAHSNLASRPYCIKNDRLLDNPIKYNHWFTQAIIENWSIYKAFITSSLIPNLQYYNGPSYIRHAGDSLTLQICDFTEQLSIQKWIVFRGEVEAYSVNEIVGIKFLDFNQTHNQVIGRYLKLLPITYELKKDFVEAINLIHLDRDSIGNFTELLNRIYKKYEIEIPVGKDFIDFYNRILGKLVDYFYNHNQTETVTQLSNVFFLGVDDISKKTVWAKAYQIFYIDDKPNYDLLPSSIKEKVQPHFTNRDKNTFGRIAAKIGKRFSNSVKKRLIESEAIQTYTLPSYFDYLPESIAVLESKLDIVMTDYFEKLKNTRIIENEKLEVEISVGDSAKLIIPVNHFIETEAGSVIHISMNNISIRNKQLAEAINELFTSLLGRDLRQYQADLLRFLNTADKKEYLRDYDILEERISEIRDKLNTSDLSANQKFWEAILSAKEISNRENIFLNKEVDVPNLSKLLEIDSKITQSIQDDFNFQQTSIPTNISLLAEILTSLHITLSDLNIYIFPKIDFREYYERRLNNFKNKFENSFDAVLHGYLSGSDLVAQENYQDYLDEYKNQLNFTIPLNTLLLDTENFFLKALNSKFSFLIFSESDLEKDFNLFNPISIYSANLDILKEQLKSTGLPSENIQIFLSDNKRRSLLYFNQFGVLADRFKEWLNQTTLRNKPINEEEDLKDYLSKFSNQESTDIEAVITNQVDVFSSPGITNGGGGRRFDGAENDQSKKIIGLVAEMVVYEKLSRLHKNVRWVSKFASKVYKTHPGYNPEGQDGLGYDIEYLDSEGNKFFIEVKGKIDSFESFEISRNEVDKAYQEKEFYKIIFVSQTLNNSGRRIRDLGNLFMFSAGEDFFANRKFTALYRNFEVRFEQQRTPS